MNENEQGLAADIPTLRGSQLLKRENDRSHKEEIKSRREMSEATNSVICCSSRHMTEGEDLKRERTDLEDPTFYMQEKRTNEMC